MARLYFEARLMENEKDIIFQSLICYDWFKHMDWALRRYMYCWRNKMGRKKFSIGDQVVGNEKKASFARRKGQIVKYESDRQYWVRFDGGREECVYSWWLDKTTSIGSQG